MRLKWTPAVPIEKVHAFEAPDAEGAADLVRRSIVAWLQAGGKELPTAASGFKCTRNWPTPCYAALLVCWRYRGAPGHKSAAAHEAMARRG